MIKDADLVVAYVNMDKKRSGAKLTIKYAQKINKPVINLFLSQDKIKFTI